MPHRAPTHRPPRPKARQHVAPEHKRNQQETDRRRHKRRALDTNDRRWRRIRAHQLKLEPICRNCYRKGIVREAREVDHIDGNDANNAPENLQSLCTPCHSRKTGRSRKLGRGGSNL